MDWFKINAKAVVAFVLTAVLQAFTDIISGTAGIDVLDWKAWLRYIGLSLLAGAFVWATGNKLDLKQILVGLSKLSVPQQEVVAQKTLDVLPAPVSDKVVSDYPEWTKG